MGPALLERAELPLNLAKGRHMTTNQEEQPDRAQLQGLREAFALSPEQQDTGALLERLLGPAVAQRYKDVHQLAAGATGLQVTVPLAAHAIREVESTIRDTLAAPLGAEAEREEGSEREARLTGALKLLGYNTAAIERAVKAVRPRTSHADQIKKIVSQLGLAPDGDIARAWIKLMKTAGGAHKRDFHRSLRIDDTFRNELQEPFDFVVRGIMVALETRFIAMTRRAEAIANMTPVSRAVNVFESELPGSLPLQWHFFQYLESPLWLPFLIEKNLTMAPAHELALGMRFRQWPIGIYLLRMAKLRDGKTPQLVVRALRTVSGSQHPDVQRQGFGILAELPAAEAATAVDIASNWLTPDLRNGFHDAPQRMIKVLAEGGYIDEAIALTRSVYQLVDEEGSVDTLHSQHMYEHGLQLTVQVLKTADPGASVALFCDLLMDGISIKNNYDPIKKQDYTYITPHPVSDDSMRAYEPYDALIFAVRDCALAAVSTQPTSTEAVVGSLFGRGPQLFKRIALHVLAKAPDAAPKLCAAYLTDTSLIGESWCEDEYAELALAWFSRLRPADQEAIWAHITTMPDQYRENWARRFEEHKKQGPSADDYRKYDDHVFLEAVWKWRAVLPKEKKDRVDEIVAEQGRPDDWQSRVFPDEVSPLEGADFAALSVPAILQFLKEWRPEEGPKKHTIAALGIGLRQAVEKDPVRFAENAHRFAALKPIYVRRLLEGFENTIQKVRELPWSPILALMDKVVARFATEKPDIPHVEGDDPDLLWACSTIAAILRFTLAQGREGIDYIHEARIRALIESLLKVAPAAPEGDGFEAQFERHSYFSASQTLRGRSVELCIMFLFWGGKKEGCPWHADPRSAMSLAPTISALLESQLNDRAPNGRVPRAVIGRWMRWLVYFGRSWLREHFDQIFPSGEPALRQAAWRGHLMNDRGPAGAFIVEMIPLYAEEIARAATLAGDPVRERDGDDNTRENRLGEYLLILHVRGELPDGLLHNFWKNASVQTLRHVIWFLGTTLQMKPDDLPDENRKRAVGYWEARLAAGIAATNKAPFRKELGAIGGWLRPKGIDKAWMLEQLLALLHAGFVPVPGYSAVEWLAERISEAPTRCMEALQLIIHNAKDDHWIYTAQRDAIRTVLTAAFESGDERAITQAESTIGYLASIGESGYQDLVPVPSLREHS